MTYINCNSQEAVEKKPLSINDEVIVNLLYALDSIDAGRLGAAKSTIKYSLSMLPRNDMHGIHNALIAMLEEGGK